MRAKPEEMKSAFFLFKLLKKTTKNITKKTSIKNRYCAEKDKIKRLFINIEIQIKLVILFLLILENMIKPIKIAMKEMLITDLIPFRKSQFLT